MKFAIAYVIGDTELHDKLCGSYGSRNSNVKMLCRHCRCPNNLSVVPQTFNNYSCWVPEDFLANDLPSIRSKEFFKSISHHDIHNVFHELEFGVGNKHNIHLATPGECLHMHQLGIAKRCLESFKYFVTSQQIGRKGSRKKAYKTVSSIAQEYGGLLHRQSDRDFPRTRYTSDIMAGAKKEGKDYAGIIYCIIMALVSGEGKKILIDQAFVSESQINEQIETLELIIGMEEFLKNGSIRKSIICGLGLEKMIVHFLNKINLNCQRKGMGTNTIKNHLYLHLPQYIKKWGPPTGWDSAPSESHHKTNIKAPSKTTQQNASLLITQTASRQTELNLIRTFQHMHDNHGQKLHESDPLPCDGICGSRFVIKRDQNNQSSAIMSWSCKTNFDKRTHPQPVIDFCCEKFLPTGGSVKVLRGFTEHKRMCAGDKSFHRFRCHPSYRADAGLKRDSWYDWAEFKFEEDDERTSIVPGQILCFLDLTVTSPPFVEGYEPGLYAVVRTFTTSPSSINGSRSKIILEGTLMEEMYVVPCDSIHDTVAVVQNRTIPITTNRFLVVKNRSYLLQTFHDTMERVSRKSLNSLYNDGDDYYYQCLGVLDDETDDDSSTDSS